MARYFELTRPPAGLAADLGPGGEGVAGFLDRLWQGALVPAPAGARVVPDLATAVRLSDRADPAWLEELDLHRTAARVRLVAAGRGDDLETALHIAMLLATPLLAPPDPADADALAASGALLWLIGTLVAVQLAGGDRPPAGAGAADPRGAGPRAVSGVPVDPAGVAGPPAPDLLTTLVAGGWWPIGPVAGRLRLARYPARRNGGSADD